ncbi:MAG: HDOD domain-containing protein, partial [Gemmatimonadetes bacterium]|nr:HDOD domain-containing protein [Gemmatimonadota bacterium]
MAGVAGLDPARFWSTAAKRAATAKLLAQELDPSTASESFTAALLQDMAVPVLLKQRGGLYADVVAAWHQGEMDLAQLERRSFEWDHALVGAQMGEHWQFPEDLVHAIGSHHSTDGGVFRTLPAVALVSNLREVDEDLGRDRLVAAAESHGISADVTVDIMDRAFESAGEMTRLFGY